MSMPMPPGTVTAWPLTNTSRWACTWKVSDSAVSGASPACVARSMAFGGAGHGAAPCAGWAAGRIDDVGASEVEDAEAFFLPDPDEHAPASARAARATARRRRVCMERER